MKRFEPLSPKLTSMYHGADYNPDQWLHMPDKISDDYRLMNLAGCNVMSVGIFAWATLEPEEGVYHFEWLDQTINQLWDHGVYTILATPSAARPAWMSSQYPEVLRVNADRTRILHSGRHNHCYTSPIYREKTKQINEQLAARYADHPGLLMWHVSNEYGGECHCELCQDAFRTFLREKYNNDLDQLNKAWWSAFWSHTYTDWSQIESPAPHGEDSVHGLYIDWKRFVTHQTASFIRNETEPLRRLTPAVPVTINGMQVFPGLDYFKLADEIDLFSWDSYPLWHHSAQSPSEVAAVTAFSHDLFRSLKGGRPFFLMESTPSQVNWQSVNKLKKPGMHRLASLQAVAHGSDSVQYFQWRKSRGSSEKFHGAVVDHVGHEKTRVFQEVSQVGQDLEKLKEVANTGIDAETAVIFDWDNRWAIEHMQALTRDNRAYVETCQQHHRAFWHQGLPVDVIDMSCTFNNYKVVVAPMLYMTKPGIADKLEAFVNQGGTLVLTYFSGLVDENDLCHLTGFPGPFRAMAGIWAEETDSLYPDEKNELVLTGKYLDKMDASYEVHTLCDLIHAETAEVLAVYGKDFYKDRPALTVNQYGKGKVYYIAARTEQRFLNDFYRFIAKDTALAKPAAELPEGMTVSIRGDEETAYWFIQNYQESRQTFNAEKCQGTDLLSGQHVNGQLSLEPYGIAVVKVRR